MPLPVNLLYEESTLVEQEPIPGSIHIAEGSILTRNICRGRIHIERNSYRGPIHTVEYFALGTQKECTWGKHDSTRRKRLKQGRASPEHELTLRKHLRRGRTYFVKENAAENCLG